MSARKKQEKRVTSSPSSWRPQIVAGLGLLLVLIAFTMMCGYLFLVMLSGEKPNSHFVQIIINIFWALIEFCTGASTG